MTAVAGSAELKARPSVDDHLVPEPSAHQTIRVQEEGLRDYWDWTYEADVGRRLSEAFDPDVFGRMIVLPLNGREYAVALRFDDAQYRILHLELSAHLLEFEELDDLRARAEASVDGPEKEKLIAWMRRIENALPPTRDDIVVNRCERNIASELGEKLYTLWSEMLFRTRYRDFRPVRPDDRGELRVFIGSTTAYHFSFEYSGVTLEGQIYNPRRESNTGQFVAIAELLKDACGARRNDDILADIEQRAEQLTATLSATAY